MNVSSAVAIKLTDSAIAACKALRAHHVTELCMFYGHGIAHCVKSPNVSSQAYDATNIE